ncbi:hypothetical protein [Mycolicibacterium vulneris]|uniref:hypothetical protein n=1 Tax=Mycolicibacterium vulneris TaxID=547163 RepID=UPI001FE98807|nr:hypothetical protein [Mycolicibacterium vulneris]
MLTTISASIAAREATALWDVSTAEHSGRRVTTFEQHVHSFLESLPIMAGSALGCLHWREVLPAAARSCDAWRLRWKENRLPGGSLAAVGAAMGANFLTQTFWQGRGGVDTATLPKSLSQWTMA